MEKGLIHIYSGDGKGKTTAAFGLALRAAGRGLKIHVIQFLKSETSGEVEFIKKNIQEIKLERFNSQKKFIWNMNDTEINILKKETRDGLEKVKEIIKRNQCDVLILDEFIWCVNENFISLNEAINLIKSKPLTMEIVITGRDAKPELIQIADYVTEMKCIKHPYEKGINSREGIEK
jgi:cob(I)alamin adenosyltransferase